MAEVARRMSDIENARYYKAAIELGWRDGRNGQGSNHAHYTWVHSTMQIRKEIMVCFLEMSRK